MMISMGRPAPGTVVLALGCGVLGAPDALRLLLTLTGQRQNPVVVDLAICVLFTCTATAHLLGLLLLARFVRNRNAPAPADAEAQAPAANCLAEMTLAVSVAVAFFVAACLVVVPGGPVSPVRIVFDVAGKSPAGAAGGFLLCITPLLRVLRRARNADGAGAVVVVTAPDAGAERFGKLARNACVLAVVCFAVAGVLSVAQIAYVPRAHESGDGNKHARSA